MRLFLLLSLLPLTVFASPFITCDSVTDATIVGTSSSIDGQSYIDNPLVSGKCKIDLQPGTTKLSIGAHNINVKFYKVDANFGRVESAITNFTFPKPGIEIKPTGLGIDP